ncbi:hypothetical protein SB748_24555 [Rhizobium sp. SIMBA_035]
MTERSDNAERLFQHLDDLVTEIIDRLANEGHGTVTVPRRFKEPANDWPAEPGPAADVKE